jgi:hypothetical protein
MPERGGRYYAVRSGSKAYSTQAKNQEFSRSLQEIALLKQRNADLFACLDERYIYLKNGGGDD